jgi:hypothetical protein
LVNRGGDEEEEEEDEDEAEDESLKLVSAGGRLVRGIEEAALGYLGNKLWPQGE